MENHIYPLNIEEPSPLSPKNKRKKPSFKEWAKERKKMIVFVCTVAVLALATVTIYATGLSDKMLGLITNINTTLPAQDVTLLPNTTIPDIGGTDIQKSVISDVKLELTGSTVKTQYMKGEEVTLKLAANRQATITKVEVLKSTGTSVKELAAYKNLIIEQGEEKTIKWDGKNQSGTYATTGNYKFKITAEYVTGVAGPTKINTLTKEFAFLTVPSPAISSVTLTITPATTQKINTESAFLVKVTGGTAPYQFNIDYGNGNEATISKALSGGLPNHTFRYTYQKAGPYTVKATVTDNFGINKSATTQYQVTDPSAQKTVIPDQNKQQNPAMTLSLTGTPASPQVAGTEVTFKLEATAGATSYNFRIQYGSGEGEGINADSKSNIATFKHKYTKAGTYTVSTGVTSTLNLNDPVHANNLTYQITETKADVVVPPPTTTQCNDGIDNDTDGKIDYPNDLGCAALDDITESPDPVTPPPGGSTPEPPLTVKETKCDDGKDNDKDGKIDYEDSDCKAPKDASIKITDVGVTSQKLNPALNAVKIYYKLSDSANVKVEIKSTQGNITVPLFEGKQEKQVGNFSVWWEGTLDNKPNGQKAPDGTYTYKISATHLKYPSVKDSKEGTITVDSAYNPGGLDFEDINNANLVGDANQGQGAGTGAGQTPSTPSTPSQNQATVAIQSATTGSTAGTGPGVVIYFLFPLFAYAYKKIKY